MIAGNTDADGFCDDVTLPTIEIILWPNAFLTPLAQELIKQIADVQTASVKRQEQT
jgi:hypothetical protein